MGPSKIFHQALQTRYNKAVSAGAVSGGAAPPKDVRASAGGTVSSGKKPSEAAFDAAKCPKLFDIFKTSKEHPSEIWKAHAITRAVLGGKMSQNDVNSTFERKGKAGLDSLAKVAEHLFD